MENLGTPSRKPPAFRRPAILLDEAEKHSDSSSSDAPDGVIFRKPMAPVQMTISPGNAANEGKLAEKLKKLELSRRKTTRAQPIDLKTPSKIDLVATERFFVESSVENIAQTPLNQSIRDPFRNAQFTHNIPQNVFSMGSPRDSMRSNVTYVLTTPKVDRALHPHNDPFTVATPSRKQTTVTTPLAYDEKLERQFVALSSWANVILDSASFVSEIDLGTSKQDASRKLQEMLTAKPSKKNGGTNAGMKGRYTDLCLRKKCLDYLKRADSVYQSILIPGKLKTMVEKGEISIKPNIEVYANIGVQTSILSLLFSLHPFWLFIGVETICAEFSDHDTWSLDGRLPFSSSSFAPATVRFIHDNILANAKLMAKKKFAIGTVKKLVTEKGREVLHKHCITCILNMAVLLEYAKNSYLFENTPGLFVKNSEIKTVTDFCTELSRLVLSASGTPLNKAFDKSSFRRTYRQSFLEEYQYAMKSMRDMADGIILGRLIELLTDSSPLSIIGNMRNPQGDRIRKKGNVEKALSAAAEAGIDVDGISIDQILSAHRESCLDLMWRLVGVYVKKKAEQEPLRRESLCLDGGTDTEEDGDDTVMGAPLGGMAESAYAVYQQLAFQFGLSLSKWADLEDGLLLSSIWQHYNSNAPDIRFYDGDNLFEKVANGAESDLGIPLALTALRDERQLGLFAHMFLSRLISYKRLRDSEMSDAESDASSIVSIIRKEGVNLSEETDRIQRVRLESERAVSAREEEERLKREEKRREDELRKRFEEEEEREEKMLMEKGEEERIEEELRRAEESQRKEEEEIERVRKDKEREEEEKRMRREEEARLEEERRRREEEEEREREKEERVKVEEEERKRREEESRLKADEEERIRREEEKRIRAIEVH
ncbi:hypothetical protein PENTCL1PPCAC_18185 [Pristionchus entomophagus]|uniref:Calponin-homology (CH) domain-containing protein n=1 Tax=Pristionchus entomophagus TaxID=358040 RepID=A0AAV5TNP3_9BILA|nr:hypothetical protein PENTCL1PPCAC_18185 [Pristionchus entomophagus]